jgi:hypothetical protein
MLGTPKKKADCTKQSAFRFALCDSLCGLCSLHYFHCNFLDGNLGLCSLA